MSSSCAHCGTQAKCRARDFSDQAWTVLVLWGEVDKKTVQEPVCDHCYSELRSILIERASEVEQAVRQPARTPAATPHRKVG
jgi:hypothetical protein